MAFREVLISICDQCGAEEQTETSKIIGKNKILLPTGWLHVHASSAFVDEVFSLDLCTKCSSPVIDLAGRAQVTK
jgi:hypothetical protein